MSGEINEVVRFETRHEAAARIRSRLQPGASVLLHAEDCAFPDAACDCEPLLIEASPS